MAEGRGCITTPQGDQIAGSRPRAGRWADRWGHRWAARKSVPIKSPIPGFQPFPGVSQGFHSCPVVRYLPKSQVAHNAKVAGSNPAPATNPKSTFAPSLLSACVPAGQFALPCGYDWRSAPGGISAGSSAWNFAKNLAISTSVSYTSSHFPLLALDSFAPASPL